MTAAQRDGVLLSANVTPTPQQVAALFWDLGSDGQADFFAELDRIAGLQLCFQMAGVVHELAKRSERGDRAGQHGFQTMLAHAQAYAESATDYRVSDAKSAIASLARAARTEQPE